MIWYGKIKVLKASAPVPVWPPESSRGLLEVSLNIHSQDPTPHCVACGMVYEVIKVQRIWVFSEASDFLGYCCVCQISDSWLSSSRVIHKGQALWRVCRPCPAQTCGGFLQLGRVVGRQRQVGRRPTTGTAAQKGFKGWLHMYVYLFWHFKCWNVDNHFYLAVLRLIFVNVFILVVATLR